METTIIDYAVFIKKSNERIIQKYQLAYDKVIALSDMAESVYAEVEELLGEDDPITEKVYFGMSNIVDEAIIMLEKVIEERTPMKLLKNPHITLKPMSPEA